MVWMVVLGLFALSLLLLLSMQRPRRPTEDESDAGKTSAPRRPSALLASLPILLLMILLIYLALDALDPRRGHPLEAPLAAIAGLLELLSQARKPPTSVAAFDYAVAGLALLLALATFALMVLVVFAERVCAGGTAPRAARIRPRLDVAVAESLDDLRTEPDARAAIIRAYRRFELALSAARVPRAGVADAGGVHAVRARPGVRCPPAPVERLTSLFELARFSERPLGADARAAACDCLDEVKTALESGADACALSPAPWRRPFVTRLLVGVVLLAAVPVYVYLEPHWRALVPRLAAALRARHGAAGAARHPRRPGRASRRHPRSMPRAIPPAVEPGAPHRLLELTASVRAGLRSRRHFETVLWPRLTALAARPLALPPLRRGRGPSLAGFRDGHRHHRGRAVKVGAIAERAREVVSTLGRIVVGKDDVIERIFAGVLANGHVLIEDYPGLAKTLIARLLAQALDLGFRRIQFTPDLLPSDITGSFLYDQSRGRFEFRAGPVFTNLLLADEINRATPKTQAALLEAMQEAQVTVGRADLSAAAALSRAGHPEPHRAGGHLSAARGPARSLPDAGQRRLSRCRHRARDPPAPARAAHGRGRRSPPSCRGRSSSPCRGRWRTSSSATRSRATSWPSRRRPAPTRAWPSARRRGGPSPC